MITGYNTDVEHDGVVYHVQTEDKGVESPIILSLVYSGGAILAAKRAPYQDLLASGFDEEVLAERLKRQHRLICAAIHAGRIADLKRMSGGEVVFGVVPPNGQAPPVSDVSEPPVVQPPTEVIASPVVPEIANVEIPVELPISPLTAEPPIVEPPLEVPASTVAEETNATTEPSSQVDARRESPLGEAPSDDQGLAITLLDSEDFKSGESLMLRVLISRRSGEDMKPLSGAQVSVKVLGTTFRPQIQTVNTERDGVATISIQIPQFTSGRAAILIRAKTGADVNEIRRVIVPGQ